MHPSKTQICQHLDALLDSRIDEAQRAIAAAQEARNNDTKSSAGDKYETGRAMMQIEIDKNEFQLGKARALKADLAKVNLHKSSPRVEFGSLVITAQETYFISIGVGKLEVDGHVVYAISVASPIGNLLQNKAIGDEIEFQGRKLRILELV